MMVVEPALRISVDDVLAHSWITHAAPKEPLLTAPNKLRPLVDVRIPLGPLVSLAFPSPPLFLLLLQNDGDTATCSRPRPPWSCCLASVQRFASVLCCCC